MMPKIQSNDGILGPKVILACIGAALIVSCDSKSSPSKKTLSDLEAAKQTVEGVLKADDIRLNKGLDYADTGATSKYFDSVLVRLFYEDEKCKERTKEICNLDANPIYAAQDYSLDGFQVRIENESRFPGMVFNVHIRNGGEQTLKYFLRKEKDQWKIADIHYPGNGTLMGWLSNKIIEAKPSDKKVIVGSP